MTTFSGADNSMSDSINSDPFTTPTKPRKPPSFSHLYLNSIKRKTKNSHTEYCSLCLLSSSDCENHRCPKQLHFVCRECACDWEADRLCPACKMNSYSHKKESEQLSSSSGMIISEEVFWRVEEEMDSEIE